MVWMIGVVVFIGGILNTIQSGSNATLAKSLGQPIGAALIISLVSTAMFTMLAAISGLRFPSGAIFEATPWWAWIGGVLGGMYVLGSILFAEKLGAALFIGLTVTAGLTTSVVLDHFGLVGFKTHTAGIGRLVGCALMIVGLILVNSF